MPDFVLYTDGQLILSTSNNLMQKTLSSTEVCTLLSKITSTGFFEVAEGDPSDWVETHKPIYQSVTATQDVGEGGLYEDIVVNGQPHKAVSVYYILKNYLVKPVRQVFDLITTYKPDGLKPYQPQQVLLWIEPLHPVHLYSDTPTPTVQSWPTNLPSLSTLLGPQDSGQALIQGGNVQPILKLFSQLPGSRLFIDQGQSYTVIARPLLPHETANNFPDAPYFYGSVELPFNCAGQ